MIKLQFTDCRNKRYRRLKLFRTERIVSQPQCPEPPGIIGIDCQKPAIIIYIKKNGKDLMGAKLEELQTVATVAYDGRVTIPKKIRETLGIDTGDKVLINVRKLEE